MLQQLMTCYKLLCVVMTAAECPAFANFFVHRQIDSCLAPIAHAALVDSRDVTLLM